MADRLEALDVICPASTLHTAPVEVALPFDGGIVRAVHIVIPAGHAGLTGIAVGFGHQPIIPFKSLTFIEGDDDVIHFPFNDKNPGVDWQAFVYNEDLQPHAWQVRFEVDEVSGTERASTTQPLSSQSIVDAGNDELASA